MNHSKWKKQLPVLLFTVTIFVFFVFFFYMYTAEKVSVYRSEPLSGYNVLHDLQMELAEDDTAPAGIRKIYRGVLHTGQSPEGDVLCFNISHHNIEVYFGDELVYRLVDDENNRIGKNVGSNWCIVNAGNIHDGEDVTVVLTPLFEAAVEKTPEFLLGSAYAIAMDLITGEMPLLILSSLCILLGLFMTAVFLYFRYVLKIETIRMFYIGLFSITMGTWKLTDLKCLPLLLPEHSMALAYICVGSLLLTGLCLLLYFSTLFVKERRKNLEYLSIGGSLLCLGILAMQILGISELRENLVFSHILLIVSIASIPLTALFYRIVHKNWGLQRSWKLLLLLFAGIAVDLLLYYRNHGNGLMSFSIMGFIVYTLIIFLQTIQDATHKAYMDSRTGLVNRTRWTELMNDNRSTAEPYAILMIDMNGLKHVNDTLGHNAGDQMIFHISSLLRNTLPRTSVICRWGGDEFAVLLTDVNREQLEQQIRKIVSAREQYNAEHPELPIYFAVGAVLSSEHPGISRSELFQLADEEMYRDKKAWYAQRESGK